MQTSSVLFISLHIRSMWETICDAKYIPVHIPQTVNFCPNFPESPFLEFQTRKPPLLENFRFEMTKVYSELPPPFQKTSDLRWPKFTPKYPPPPPISENFRFEMTKVYPEIPPPHFGKLQIWDDQSLPQNTPPHFGKLQIWDDQSLLQNTPPPISGNPGDRMWRLICNPQGYHSFLMVQLKQICLNVPFWSSGINLSWKSVQLHYLEIPPSSFSFLLGEGNVNSWDYILYQHIYKKKHCAFK